MTTTQDSNSTNHNDTHNPTHSTDNTKIKDKSYEPKQQLGTHLTEIQEQVLTVDPLHHADTDTTAICSSAAAAITEVDETVRVRNQPSKGRSDASGSASRSLLDVFAAETAEIGRTLSSPTKGQQRNTERNVGSNHEEPVLLSSSAHIPPLTFRRSASHRLHHPHHSHEPSLNDLNSLMREQDAELLESLVFSAANDDVRGPPLPTAAAAATGRDLNQLKLETCTTSSLDGSALSMSVAHDGVSGATTAEGAAIPIPVSPSMARPLSSTSSTASSSRRGTSGTRPASLRTLLVRHESAGDENVNNLTALPSLDEATVSSAEGGALERSARRALSGEIWVETSSIPTTTQPGTIPTTTGVEITRPADLDPALTAAAAPDGPPIPPLSSTTIDLPLSPTEQPLNRRMVRSESMDRRLNEAAQFAEAVGELRLAEQEELRIIDEEDQDAEVFYDSDDDDNATEIHVEGDDSHHTDNSRKSRQKDELMGMPIGEVTFVQHHHHQSHKVRPQWPFRTQRTKGGFLDKLPENGTAPSQDFVYKGIRANPPEIVKRGVTRGNYSCLHRKAWLECTDKYHRYGKNLRLYYRYWERLGFPTNMFFDWLDSKGEAAGQPLPELDECPRSQLDSDTVLYITDEKETRGYSLEFIVDDHGQARVVDVDNELVKTGPDGWIFVLRDNVMYGAQKITSVKGHCKQRFHHSSFFGGKAVAAAGIFITDDSGGLRQVLPHSGHYRPGEAHMQRMLFFLHNQGVDLWTFEVDMQQILHVARDNPTDGNEKSEKKKKIECLRLIPAGLVACYLAHKARFIGEGIFAQIHRIRKADVATVSEALELIDDGSIIGRSSGQNLDVSS